MNQKTTFIYAVLLYFYLLQFLHVINIRLKNFDQPSFSWFPLRHTRYLYTLALKVSLFRLFIVLFSLSFYFNFILAESWTKPQYRE